MKKKLHFVFKFDHIIDIITNSSSELFVIENKCAKTMLVDLLNNALKGIKNITEDDIEDRFKKDGDMYDQQYEIDNALELFPEDDRDILKEKYFSSPKYYGISFDRDWIYNLNSKCIDIRNILIEIGFELVDTDY